MRAAQISIEMGVQWPQPVKCNYFFHFSIFFIIMKIMYILYNISHIFYIAQFQKYFLLNCRQKATQHSLGINPEMEAKSHTQQTKKKENHTVEEFSEGTCKTFTRGPLQHLRGHCGGDGGRPRMLISSGTSPGGIASRHLEPSPEINDSIGTGYRIKTCKINSRNF